VTFTEFVVERQRGLLRFAMVLTGDAPLSEEIVQEVLVRAYERWEHVGALEHANAYVRRMVVNEFVSWRRKWSRVERFDLAAHGIAQSDHAEAYAERNAVLADLARLPRKQRAVLVLRYYDGLSDAEIAEVLGCSAGTVRGYASRALATLRIETGNPSTTSPAGTASKEGAR
jgi:RNA polymerase sigma-70 factor (sigma-E family)